MSDVFSRACLTSTVALGCWWDFVSVGFWFGLAWHDLVIAGCGALVGVILVVVIFVVLIFVVVGGESGDELESFEAFGEWGVGFFAVFGSPSSHPFVDIFGFVELADVGFDGTDGLFDVLFFEGVPVAASFAEHHDPYFVDFPRVETLRQEAFVPEVIAC